MTVATWPHSRGRTLLHLAGITAAVVLVAIVIWIDVATGLWQDTVILAGIAAGLLTFVLTAVFLDRWIAQNDHNRWLPVTRLALTDLLHGLADDESSELSRGMVVPRRLAVAEVMRPSDTEALLHAIVAERREISEVLSRWAGFLAASADVRPLMVHMAGIAECLDRIRDDALEYETAPPGSQDGDRTDLLRTVDEYHHAVEGAIGELATLLSRARQGDS